MSQTRTIVVHTRSGLDYYKKVQRITIKMIN
jgi:hypothetical protein